MSTDFGTFEKTFDAGTGSFRRSLEDFLQAILLGIAAAALFFLGVHMYRAVLIGLAGVALTLAQLLCSKRARFLAPLIFCTTGFFLPVEMRFGIVRAAGFAIVIGFLPRTVRTLCTVYVVLGMWAVVLAANLYFIEMEQPPFIPLTEAFFVTMVTEVAGALTVQLVCWTRTFTSLFYLPPRRYSLTAFLLLFAQGAGILSALGALAMAYGTSPYSVSDLAASFYRPQTLGGLLLIFLLPSVIVLPLARFLRNSLEILRIGATEPPTPELLLSQPLLNEFRETQVAIYERVSNLRGQIAQAERKAAKKAEPAADQKSEEYLRAENLAQLAETAPLGAMVVGSTGIVLAMTRRCNTLLGVEANQVLGKSISKLKFPPVACELANVLAQTISRGKQLAGLPTERFVSQAEGERQLEFLVSVENTSSSRFSEVGLPEYTTPSTFFVVVYIQEAPRVPDAPPLDLAGPTPLEIAGANALALTNELELDFEDLGTTARIAEKLAQGGGGDLGRQLAALFGDIVKFTDDAITDVRNLFSMQGEVSGKIVDENFHAVIEEDLAELKRLAPELRQPSLREPAGSNETDLIVSAPKKELHRFRASLIALFRSAAGKGSEVSINLSTRSIHSDEIANVPGARGGEYLVIDVGLPGISLAPSLLPSDFRLVISSATELYTFEEALIAAGIQVRRLFGFSTHQNLAARGSTLTFCIPKSPLSVEEGGVPLTRGRSRFHSEALE